MTFEEIFGDVLNSPEATIARLKEKTIFVPAWSGNKGLVREYNPDNHPVMSKALYPDVARSDGSLEQVTRITLDYQRLAVKRMSELVCGIPVKRNYSPENDKQQEIASYIEKILQRNRIDSFNIERTNLLFASCEVLTLWYAVEQPNAYYGFNSPLKFRCRNFSPMNGDEIYPYFDEYGDLIAISIGYKKKVGKKTISYFDVYASDRHIKYSDERGGYGIVEDEKITIGKIPAIYTYRPTPIWEDTSKIVYEMEWALSRNGNYLRKNSKPLFVVFADEQISYGDEPDANKEFRSVLQYPQGSSANYVTWPQAVDNLKYYISELRNMFFTQLQLPDWSYEKMSQQAMSGESRKQLFIDAQLKVRDESGRLLEFFDREINVIKAFVKSVLPTAYHTDIDALQIETEITPFSINDETETIQKLVTANGGKPIISQRESIKYLGWSTDIQRTMEELNNENEQSLFENYN